MLYNKSFFSFLSLSPHYFLHNNLLLQIGMGNNHIYSFRTTACVMYVFLSIVLLVFLPSFTLQPTILLERSEITTSSRLPPLTFSFMQYLTCIHIYICIYSFHFLFFSLCIQEHFILCCVSQVSDDL